MVDVSVVVAVYNTMPYLTRCLDSLVTQTIGPDRLQIVAVDDGSTDGSGAELDRFAAAYPGSFEVIHQANSGGPAAPSNLGLSRATGRYVFFVGADDYLERDALAAAVAMADEHGSDVVAIRMVGENGRFVHQGIFKRSAVDLDLADSDLAWSLSNVKLFRRELLERHAIRYPEELAVSSDQPFTLAALVAAARVSVLADKIYYHVVRRADASNITYSARFEERLRCTESIMAVAERLLAPGPARDAVHRRHLTWEAAKLLEPGLLELDRDDQEWICAGVGRLAKLYLTDAMAARIDFRRRLRLRLARAGAVDALLGTLAQDLRGGPPIIVAGGRAYAGYTCFRDRELGLPDDLFDLTHSAAKEIAERLVFDSVGWEPYGAGEWAVAVTVGPGPATPPVSLGRLAVTADEIVAPFDPEVGTAGARARVPLAALFASCPPDGVRHPLRLRLDGLVEHGHAPVRVSVPAPRRAVHRRVGLRLYRATLHLSPRGQVSVDIRPVTLRRAAGWAWRRARRPR